MTTENEGLAPAATGNEAERVQHPEDIAAGSGKQSDPVEAVVTGQTGTSPKKVRGKSQRSRDLIAAMREAAEKAQPITGRGSGYKMFVRGLIPSMSRQNMRCIYRLLKDAREDGTIPWHWIVDETRSLERTATWDDPDEFADMMAQSYRRDFWNQQPVRVEVWSEKGTVRGVLKPVLNKYAVGFRVMHGFSSSTSVYEVCQDDDGRDLIALYVGDYDPSGLYMSEHDLPDRLKEYEGDHVTLKRIALTGEQAFTLQSFPAADKSKDPRYKWFTSRHGDRCWELDAMDPNDLRNCVEEPIKELIEPEAWARCEVVNRAEKESLKTVLDAWGHVPETWESAYQDWHKSGDENSGTEPDGGAV
jgi:hypothetical protein